MRAFLYFVCDFRKLNGVTVKHNYSLVGIEESPSLLWAKQKKSPVLAVSIEWTISIEYIFARELGSKGKKKMLLDWKKSKATFLNSIQNSYRILSVAQRTNGMAVCYSDDIFVVFELHEVLFRTRQLFLQGSHRFHMLDKQKVHEGWIDVTRMENDHGEHDFTQAR